MTLEMKEDDIEDESKKSGKNYTKREKISLIISFILILASIILLIWLLHLVLIETDICLTKDCAVTASTIISAMDTSVNPCENFYQFACANFIRKNPIPDEYWSFTSRNLFIRDFNIQLKDLIEDLDSSSEPSIVSKIQEYYHVCINTTYQPERELDAFRNYSVDILNWPLAEGKNWQKQYRDFNEFMVKAEEKGCGNELFPITLRSDYEDPTKLDIQIGSTDFSYFFTYILSTLNSDEGSEDTNRITRLKAEKNLLETVAYLLGNKDKDMIEQDIRKMNDLAQASSKLQSELRKNGTEVFSEEIMSVLELNKLTENKIDWLKVLNLRMKNRRPRPIKNYDLVKIYNKTNFQIFPELLRKYPLRVFLNINGWKTMFPKTLSFAGPLIEVALKEFHKATRDRDEHDNDPPKPKKRWYQCIEYMQDLSIAAITRIFINKYVDKNDKANADEMIQLIQKAYKKNIQQSDWLDEETRKNAMIKADAIRRFVAYPDFIFDNKKMEEEHADVPEVKATFFENMMQFSIRLEEYYWKEPIHEHWISNPLVVNAFYDPEGNSIWFPTGILQMPFFDSTRLAAVNFGMIGSVIGHELGHAFDNQGSNFDEKGNIRDWWSNKTREIFEGKAECFVEQYNAFCPHVLTGENGTKICVNGRKTLGENLADNTGLRAAFEAYKMWVNAHGKEKRLPGLQEYSPEQLFFIGYAYEWCQNVRIDKWEYEFMYSSHSTGMYRVLGPLANSEDFRKAFNCPIGNMNRGKDSCKMW